MTRLIDLIVAALLVCGLATGTALAKTRNIENAEMKYSVDVPSECRVEEGPGTLEAVCSPDFDEAKSAEIPAAAALLLEVDAELVPSDAKAEYGEADFRLEVPEAVCGEADVGKFKIANLKVAKDGGAITYSATVTCAEIKFLGLAERSAEVRYVMTPRYRYRLMARGLAADSDKAKAAVDAFLGSFKSTVEKKS